MPKVHKFLNLAREISRSSTSIQQKMAAIVVNSGKIVSIGINRNFAHAEARALRPHMDLKGCDIYISRWNGRTSKPCPDCQDKILAAGINRCYYIDVKGNTIEERLRIYSRAI